MKDISIPILQFDLKRPFWRKIIHFVVLMDAGCRILFMAGVLYIISISILVGCKIVDYCHKLLIIFSVVYIVGVLLFTIIGLWHIRKWFIKNTSKTINCPTCGNVVNITSIKNESTVTLSMNPFADVTQYYRVLLAIFFRRVSICIVPTVDWKKSFAHIVANPFLRRIRNVPIAGKECCNVYASIMSITPRE